MPVTVAQISVAIIRHAHRTGLKIWMDRFVLSSPTLLNGNGHIIHSDGRGCPLETALLPEADADLASLADATLSDSIFGFQFLAGVDHAMSTDLPGLNKKRAPEQFAPAPVSFRLGSLPLYCFTTFAAWNPLGPSVISNSTASPSERDLKPSPWIAE